MDRDPTTPPRAPALSRNSWISYSPDAPYSPSPTRGSLFQPRTSYARPKPSAYKRGACTTLPTIAPPRSVKSRTAAEEAAHVGNQEDGDASGESEGARVDIEGEVFGGDRFSNIFVLSSSPTSSIGSSDDETPRLGAHGSAVNDSPPTSNASTPTNASLVNSSPFGKSTLAGTDRSLHPPQLDDEALPFPLPEWCNPFGQDLLTPASATFPSLADDDMTPIPLTPRHLTHQRDAAAAAWTAELYASLASPSPKQLKSPTSPSSRSPSGASTPRHPFHYCRTSPLPTPHRSPARSRQSSLVPGGRRKSSTVASPSFLAISPGLHSPIRLGRNFPILPASPPPAVKRRKSAVALARKEERRRRRAEEAAVNPLQIDMAALDSFFGVTPEASKASRGGYGGLGLERERGIEGEQRYSEFQSLLKSEEETEELKSDAEARSDGERGKRRPPPLDLSHARSNSVSTAIDSWDDSPRSAHTIATGSPWRDEHADPFDEVGDPLSREIRRRNSEEWCSLGRGRSLYTPSRDLRKKKSVADLFKGLIFGEKGGKGRRAM